MVHIIFLANRGGYDGFWWLLWLVVAGLCGCVSLDSSAPSSLGALSNWIDQAPWCFCSLGLGLSSEGYVGPLFFKDQYLGQRMNDLC